VFKSANALVGWLLQQAADRADASYQPRAGQTRKGRATIGVQGIFGTFQLERDYYYHPGKEQGHHPADAALGLEVGYTPALAKLICLEGADEPTYLKAERHLEQTGGMTVSARQIQRVVQRVGVGAQPWQERERSPGECAAPVLYVSADGTGVPMAAPELKGRRGKQPTARPKRARFIWAASSPRTGRMRKAVRCGTTNPQPTFRVSSPLMNSGRCCGRRPLVVAWAAPARWWC
jgi:hypothetical protein